MSDGQKTFSDFILPSSVVSKLDVSRLVTEAERVDGEMTTAGVRAGMGQTDQPKPVMSEQLSEFLSQNQLELDDSNRRSELIKQMRQLKDNVPIIHMTFSVEADRDSLSQLAAWLREQIHKQAVISVGLQPALIAGVYLRTPNHVHDLSLKAKLAGSRDLLVKELEAIRG